MKDEIGIIKYLFNKGHLKLEFHTPQSVKTYYQCLTHQQGLCNWYYKSLTGPKLEYRN